MAQTERPRRDALLWISKTGMEAQQLQLDTIAHNLANTSTSGWRARRVRGPDNQNLRQAGANSSEQTTLPTGLQAGLGTRRRDRAHVQPGQPAAEFEPARPGDPRRRILITADARHLRLHPRRLVPGRRAGVLVTNNGFPLQPGITIPANAQSVTIGSDGTVSVTVPGQSRRRPSARSSS